MKTSIARSTGIVALCTLASRVLGFVRDMIIAAVFGASASLDGFFVAFRIPNLFRRLVAEGALSISFIPVYTEYLETRGEKEALRLAQKMFTMMCLVLCTVVGLGIIFSPGIVRVFAPGFSDTDLVLRTVSLNRVMFPYLLMVGIVAFSMGVLNSRRYFFAPAFSPVLLNVGFIVGALTLSKLFDQPLYGLACGVLLGGLMQLLLQIPWLVKSGFRLKIDFRWDHPGIKRILRLLGPFLFATSIYQINILVNTMLASFLPDGSISWLYYSDRLTEITLGIFVMSIGSVILPEISSCAAKKDFVRMNRILDRSMRAALFMAFPASGALMTAGFPIISTLFMHGEFSVNDAILANRALFSASLGIMSIAMVRIITPSFYAVNNTRGPVVSTIIAFLVNLICGVILMNTSLRHAGLALANSIAVTVQMIYLTLTLRRSFGLKVSGNFIKWLLKVLIATGLMCSLLFLLIHGVNWTKDPVIMRALALAGIVVAGGLAYLMICLLLRVIEVRHLMMIVKKMIC